MTKTKIINLKSKKDLNIGLLSSDQSCTASFNSPGFKNCIVVDEKKYKKKAIKNQCEVLNL